MNNPWNERVYKAIYERAFEIYGLPRILKLMNVTDKIISDLVNNKIDLDEAVKESLK